MEIELYNMKKVIINIDWIERNFGAAPQNDEIACVATGKTLQEVKEAIVEALKFHVEGLIANGDSVPEELKGQWEPEFVLTTRAQLRYSEKYITRKALAIETGINEQQLSHYANGWKKPRPETQRRILDGIHAIAQHLSLIL